MIDLIGDMTFPEQKNITDEQISSLTGTAGTGNIGAMVALA